MRRYAFAVLTFSTLAAAATPDKNRRSDLAPLHVRLEVPSGWTLNDGRARDGWASLYWSEVKDPAEAGIDILFYPKGERLSSLDGYMTRLSTLGASKAAEETFNGRHFWRTERAYDVWLNTYTTKARRAPARETDLLLEHPKGLVVVRLQASRARHAGLLKTLRAVAGSIEPI